MNTCCVYWLFDAGCSLPEKDGYIGITNNLPKRIRRHVLTERFPAFSVKVLFEGTRHECSALEFNFRPQIGIGWNLGTGGKSTHGTLGKTLSVVTRKKMRLAHANRPKELRDLYGELAKGNKSRTGQTFSVEQRSKMSAAKVGNKNSVGNQSAVGAVRSDKQRAALSMRMKGKRLRLGAKLTKQQRANISAGRIGKGIGNQNWRKRKAVIQAAGE